MDNLKEKNSFSPKLERIPHSLIKDVIKEKISMIRLIIDKNSIRDMSLLINGPYADILLEMEAAVTSILEDCISQTGATRDDIYNGFCASLMDFAAQKNIREKKRCS